MNIENLKQPFPADDIEWRMQQSGLREGKPWGKCLAYVTNRAIMERLDDVCGPENWRNEFTVAPNGGVLCRLFVRIDNEWISKEDGADNTDIEAVKGGLSSAMKRAAVHWGIGRYLYNLDEGWADFSKNGKYNAKIKDDKGSITWHKWNPPKLPDWALPKAKKQQDKNEAVDEQDDPEKAKLYSSYVDILLSMENVDAVKQYFTDNSATINESIGGTKYHELLVLDYKNRIAELAGKIINGETK